MAHKELYMSTTDLGTWLYKSQLSIEDLMAMSLEEANVVIK